jgi:hypothetical protein
MQERGEQQGEERAGQSEGMEQTGVEACPRGRPSQSSQSSCYIMVIAVKPSKGGSKAADNQY